MVAGQEYHFNMRRRFTQVLSAAVVLVSGAFAQGPPASVTSPGFGGNFGRSSNGVPASVTSPGFGQTGSNRFFFSQPTIHPFPGTRTPVGNHHHNNNFFPNRSFGGALYAVPYYVPVETVEPVDDTMEQMSQQPGPYLGGPTMFDRRGPGVAVPVAPPERAPQRESESEMEAAPIAEPPAAAEQPETLLIFKDGHHVAVQNYAIVGDMLYDMTPGHSRKVLLADLDLDATMKQNDDRGIDFRLPPNSKAR